MSMTLKLKHKIFMMLSQVSGASSVFLIVVKTTCFATADPLPTTEFQDSGDGFVFVECRSVVVHANRYGLPLRPRELRMSF